MGKYVHQSKMYSFFGIQKGNKYVGKFYRIIKSCLEERKRVTELYVGSGVKLVNEMKIFVKQ